MKNLIVKAFKGLFGEGPMEEFTNMAIKDLQQYRMHAIYPSRGYPVLKVEHLDYIFKKMSYQYVTLEDFEVVDHYLTSAGFNNYVDNRLRECDVHNDVYLEHILQAYLHPKSGEVVGVLLTCINKLRKLVLAGEKLT